MLRTFPFDVAEHLDSPSMINAYLDVTLESGDASLIASALGDIARAQGMGKVARRANRGRESLYKALSKEGNPSLDTVLRVIDALGFRLTAVPVKPSRKTGSRRKARSDAQRP
jgi:probable addiction module antidote protein